MSCAENTVIGPLLAIVGAAAFYFGIMCWTKPTSKIVQHIVFSRYEPAAQGGPINRFFGMTRESAGPANLWVWRFLGPLNGSVFFIVGLWLTFGQGQCTGFHLPNPLQMFGSLEFTFWPPMIPFALFAGAIAFWRNRTSGLTWSIPFGFLGLCFGFAGAEAAAFHNGVQADRWGLVTFAAVFLSVILYMIRINSAKRPPNA